MGEGERERETTGRRKSEDEESNEETAEEPTEAIVDEFGFPAVRTTMRITPEGLDSVEGTVIVPSACRGALSDPDHCPVEGANLHSRSRSGCGAGRSCNASGQKDQWKYADDVVTREHNQPRRAMFTPSGGSGHDSNSCARGWRPTGN